MTIPTFFKTTFFSRMGRYAASVLALIGAVAFAPYSAPAAEVDEDHTVDVLFVYLDATQATLGSEDGVKAQANKILAYSNKALENSQINGQFRLVGLRKYTGYVEKMLLAQDVEALANPNDGVLDEIHQWRDEFAADMVVLLRSSAQRNNDGTSLVGRANGILNTLNGQPDIAFSVFAASAPDDVVAHEIGHNMGCAHDIVTSGGSRDGLFPYSVGYFLHNGGCTIMSYDFNNPYTANYRTIPYFSNPEVSYAGEPTGVDSEQPDAADNAKTLNQTFPVVSKYRKFKPGVATPVITPAGGNYAVEQMVTITCESEGATIRYTLDGSPVFSTSPVYDKPFELRYSGTVKARAFNGNVIPSETAEAVFRINYPDTVEPVIFTPAAGEYEDSVTVSLTSATPGADIYYTSKGEEVSEASGKYTKPIKILRDVTIKARAYKFRHNPSEQTSADYVIIVLPQAEKPGITLTGELLPQDGGSSDITYKGPPTVTITPVKPGDILRYSIDNSDVTEDSPLYTGPFLVTRTTNIKARTWRPGHRFSEERVVSVKVSPIPVAKPRISPNGGSYVNSIAVQLASDTTRAYLRYTQDGRDLPDKIAVADNDKYPIYDPAHPIVLTANTVLKVRGYDVDYLTSEQTNSAEFRIRSAEDIRLDFGSHIAAGESHSLFLNTTTNVLSAAGRNNYGQLGNGNNLSQATPVNIANNVSVVDATRDHTLFITKDSLLYGTGRNDYGQLGDSTTTNRSTPVLILRDVLFAAAGGYHTLFVTNTGELHAAGRNDYGQLGDGTATNRTSPVKIVSEGVLLVAAGKFHSLYLLGDGELWGMGRNSEGQLGQGSTVNYRSPVKIASKVRAIAAGASHTLYLLENGDLYGTGSNAYGQLRSDPAALKYTLTPVLIAQGVRSISSGDDHILYATNSGALYALGSNASGQLGLSTATAYSFTPRLLTNGVSTFAAGGGHTVYTLPDGTRYSLGANAYGQLGDGTTTNKDTPSTVPEGPISTAPSLSPEGGSFEETAEVRITGGDAGATIRYTTDGSDVTATSPIYSTPFTITRSSGIASGESEVVIVKARAWLGSRPPSVQALGRFTLLPPVERITPVITLQPENQIVVAWSPTIFIVSATGSPTPSYQWYFNGNRITGATSSSYSIERTTTAHVGTYHVVVTNPAGSAESARVALSLLNPPTITRQPVSQDIYEGGEIHLAVSIVSDSPSAYQWRRDGQDISGASSATLSIPNARVSQSGSYDVVVSNAAGSLVSNPVSVFVRPNNGLPVILRQPLAPSSSWIGGTATFSVNVSSPSQNPASYQWYRNNVVIKGATESTYTIPTLTAAHAGDYSVEVSNSRGSVRSVSTTLSPDVPQKPQVVRPLPLTTEIGLGQPVTLAIEITAYPEPEYQWYFNGNPISGATGSSYHISSVAENNLGDYSVSATSGPNVVTSGPTWLTVVNAPVILTRPAEDILSGVAGKGVALAVEIENGGASLIDYQWLLDGVAIAGANAATHQAIASGLYSVRVSNGAGSVIGEIAKVKIVGPPVIGAFSATPTTGGSESSRLLDVLNGLNKINNDAIPVIANDPVSFEVAIQGGDEPFHYVWLLDGAPLYGAPDAPVYVATDINRDSTYAVKVTNSVGEALSKTIAVRVIQPPQIIRHPVSLELKAGQRGTLSVTAVGSGQLTYQWFKDGVLIPRAVLDTYTIYPATTATAGTYWVVVSNLSKIPSKSKEVEVRVSNVNTIASVAAAAPLPAGVSSGNGIANAVASSSAAAAPASGSASSASAAKSETALKSGNFTLSGEALAALAGSTSAPADLSAGLRIVLAGELADTASKEVQPDESVLEILAGRRLPNGSYTYERTSATTAMLTYVIHYGDAASERLETGVILLSFDSATGGTYVLSGEYNGLSSTGAVSDGGLSGLGDFKVEGK